MDTIHKLVKIEKRSSQSQKFHLLDLTMSDQKKPSQSFMLIPLMKRFPVGPVLTHRESLTLFGLSNHGWPPSQLWCYNKNALSHRCFTSTSFAPHLFPLCWLKLNLALLLD